MEQKNFSIYCVHWHIFHWTVKTMGIKVIKCSSEFFYRLIYYTKLNCRPNDCKSYIHLWQVYNTHQRLNVCWLFKSIINCKCQLLTISYFYQRFYQRASHVKNFPIVRIIGIWQMSHMKQWSFESNYIIIQDLKKMNSYMMHGYMYT